jgi:hypothetical protein
MRLTRIVLMTLLVSSLLMGAIGFIMSQFIAFGLNTPIVFVAGFAIVIGGVLYYFRRESAGTRGY